MTEIRPVNARVPWIVATSLAAVAAVLAVLVFVLVLPDRHHREHVASQVGLTAIEQSAVTAAAQQVLNMLTYSRKTFDADYARAVAGATGSLKSDLLGPTEKSTLLQQMTSGKFDLQGQVTASAFEDSSGSTYQVLISADGYKIPDGASKTLTSTARFEVTLQRVGTRWLASDLESVGLI